MSSAATQRVATARLFPSRRAPAAVTQDAGSAACPPPHHAPPARLRRQRLNTTTPNSLTTGRARRRRHRRLPHSELDRVATTLLEKTNEAMALTEGVPLGVGSRDSFEEVVLRSPHRYDVPAPFEAFSEGDLAKCRAVAEATLGADCKEAFCGIVLSKPGAPAAGLASSTNARLRRTSIGEDPQRLGSALDDRLADYESGPTEFVPRSHVATNHHTGSFDEDIVLAKRRSTGDGRASSLPPDVVAAFCRDGRGRDL